VPPTLVLGDVVVEYLLCSVKTVINCSGVNAIEAKTQDQKIIVFLFQLQDFNLINWYFNYSPDNA
jgi:hypothetical protein